MGIVLAQRRGSRQQNRNGSPGGGAARRPKGAAAPAAAEGGLSRAQTFSNTVGTVRAAPFSSQAGAGRFFSRRKAGLKIFDW